MLFADTQGISYTNSLLETIQTIKGIYYFYSGLLAFINQWLEGENLGKDYYGDRCYVFVLTTVFGQSDFWVGTLEYSELAIGR